jgi:hypothetical protein
MTVKALLIFKTDIVFSDSESETESV